MKFLAVGLLPGKKFIKSSKFMRNKLLTTEQAAKFLGMSKAFLERDRWASARTPGRGPRIPFVRVGKRAVRYERAVLEALVRDRTRRRVDRARLLGEQGR